MNFYPFHIGDYLSHTSHLSDAEDLAYRRMLDLYYQTEQPFSDAQYVARRVRSDIETVHILLEEFFVERADGWHHLRCDEEIAKYHARAENARKANETRWSRATSLKSDPDQILTKNQEPRTNISTTDVVDNLETKKPKRATQLPDEFRSKDEHATLASNLRVDLAAEMVKFADYHRARGSTMKDWDAALRTWIRNAAEFNRGKPAAKRSSYVHDLSQMDYTRGVDEDGNF